MKNIWKRLLGIGEDDTIEAYDDAVARAKRLIDEGNHEDACHILRHAEHQRHAEGMYLLAWCHWLGRGVREDAGRAVLLWRRAAEQGYVPSMTRMAELEEAKERAARRHADTAKE